MLVVLTTAPNEAEGERLARKMVEEKLAACVQILPPIKSFYFWENGVENETEYLLLIKTLTEKFAELEKFIKDVHTYEVPEVVALRAEKVSERYSNWLTDYLLK